jgi:hypothetical protein
MFTKFVRSILIAITIVTFGSIFTASATDLVCIGYVRYIWIDGSTGNASIELYNNGNYMIIDNVVSSNVKEMGCVINASSLSYKTIMAAAMTAYTNNTVCYISIPSYTITDATNGIANGILTNFRLN